MSTNGHFRKIDVDNSGTGMHISLYLDTTTNNRLKYRTFFLLNNRYK